MKTKIRIKITKCSADIFWYKNFIGRVFEVTREDEFGAYRVAICGTTNAYCVQMTDCEIIKEKEMKTKIIRITGCKSDLYWYNNLVDSCFEVDHVSHQDYYVNVGASTEGCYCISREDAIVIEPIPEKVYTPFTNENGASIIGCPIRNKEAPKYIALITWVGLNYIYTSNNKINYASFQELFDDWTFLDGSPCGKLV